MKRLALLAILPLALTACVQSPHRNDTPAMTDATTFTTYHWQLSDARNTEGQRIESLFVRDDKPVQLDFNENRFFISNACNQMGGTYTLKNGQIDFGPMAATLMMCADEKLARLDREIGERLKGTASFALETASAPQLTLTTEAGDILSFNGETTAETRYGSAGETVFLEVAAQTRSCSHPLIPNMQCLQVRKIYFDEKGLKVVPSARWENFYQQIEGYTHEDGIRNVLRVKRFKVANAPADAPDTAYVLDMVVESEVVD